MVGPSWLGCEGFEQPVLGWGVKASGPAPYLCPLINSVMISLISVTPDSVAPLSVIQFQFLSLMFSVSVLQSQSFYLDFSILRSRSPRLRLKMRV